MAIAFDAATTGTAAGAGSLTFSHSVGAGGADRLLVVAVSIDNRTVTGVTYGGTAMTSVGSATNGAQVSHMWRLIAPATGANNVVVTLSGGGTDIVAVATSYTGVDQTTPLGTAATATGTSTTASVAVTSATDELVVDSVSSNLGTLTVGAGQTQRGNTTAGDNFGGASEEVGATSVTMSWTIGSSSAWASVGVSIKGIVAVTHATSGAPAAQSAAVSGVSVLLKTHATSGSPTASSSTVAGVSSRFAIHATSGAPVADSAVVAGSASRSVVHSTTGAPVAGSATVAGTASKFAIHASSGNPTADSAIVAGVSANLKTHVTSGSPIAGSAVVVGAASILVIHATSGSVIAGSAVVSGTASRFAIHTTSGSVVADSAIVSGVASRFAIHTTTGSAVADSAVVAGSASRSSIPATIARPNADTAAGSWLPSTGTSLFAMVDEVIADDTDYIFATVATTCTLALNAVVDPLTSSGQVVEYRAWSPTGTGGVTIRLKQGAVVIASWTHAPGTLTTVPTAYQQVLTAAECDAITNYSNLFIEPVAL